MIVVETADWNCSSQPFSTFQPPTAKLQTWRKSGTTPDLGCLRQSCIMDVAKQADLNE